MSDLIQVDKRSDEIAYLTFNRPEKKNALSCAMMKEALDAVEQLEQDPLVRVIVLRGKGDAFCTGLDLKETIDLTKAEEAITLYAELLNALYELPQLTICSVHGYALAGGCGIAAVTDFIIAGAEAKFGFPEVQRGLVPSVVLAFLYRHFGDQILRELLLFGEQIDAYRARDLHFVNLLVDDESLEAETERRAFEALKSSPHAVAQIKKLMREKDPFPFEEELAAALSLHKLARTHKEATEGLLSFKEKRKPYWWSEREQ